MGGRDLSTRKTATPSEADQHPLKTPNRVLPIVTGLGLTQTLAWASTYYIPAVLADPIAADLRISTTSVFGAFSAALLVAAIMGPHVGRTVDAIGGRRVLALSNIVIATGLMVLSAADGQLLLWLAWLLLGAGMGLGLYDAAFAALGRIFGAEARPAIAGITLFAGFASTVGWPLSAWGASALGWREVCLAWAGVHILVGLPLNLFLLPKVQSSVVPADTGPVHIPMDRTMVLLAVAMSAAWTVTAAMAAHLPRILEAAGATTTQAISAGALIGPSQVAARLFEISFLSRYHPLLSGRLAASAHPIGAIALALLGTLGTTAFAILHGAGNGILTIARGTIPLAIFGPTNYGYRLGLLGAPSRVSQAAAPLAFGVLIEKVGAWALVVSSGLSLVALTALVLVSTKPRE